MFEDETKDNSTPPNNLPVREAEDMFAEVDNKTGESTPSSASGEEGKIKDALSAGALQPKTPTQPAQPTPGNVVMPNLEAESDLDKQAGSLNQISKYKMKGPILGKILFIILIVVIIAGVGFGAWWVYAKMFNKSTTITQISPTTTVTTNVVSPVVSTTTNKETNKDVTDVNTTTQINNQIKADEILFGEPIDTDGDGLDDIREKQLGTDVNKKDTDGDGLIDGDEFFIWKTNPLNKDTDGDTYLDGEEIKNGFSPLGPGKLLNIPVNVKQSTSTN